jgi:hypothetical protein
MHHARVLAEQATKDLVERLQLGLFIRLHTSIHPYTIIIIIA